MSSDSILREAIVNQKNDKLVLRDIPFSLWLFGILSLVYGVYSYLQRPDQWVIAAIGAGIFLLILLLTSVLTVTADRATGTLTIQHSGLLHRKVREVPIADIAAVELERSYSSGSRHNSSPAYRIVVVTKNNETIPFRSYYSSGLLVHQARVKRLQEYLGVGGMDLSLKGMIQAASTQAAGQFRQEQESITGSQEQEHVTDGVRWRLTTRAAGANPISVWHSNDFEWPGHFLYLAQKVTGQSSTGGVMALMGNRLLKTSMTIYGFEGEMTPGLENASQLSPLDPQIEPLFFAFTSNPAGARQILNPWVVMPLAAWAQKYPLRQINTGLGNQLAVLFGPRGVSLAMLGLIHPELLEELTRLGVELVKAQGGGR
jgi:hypothetical protein